MNEINKSIDQTNVYTPNVYESLLKIGNKEFKLTKNDFNKIWNKSYEDKLFLKKFDIRFNKKTFEEKLSDQNKSDYIDEIDDLTITIAKQNFLNEIMSKYLQFVINIHLDKFNVETFKHRDSKNIIKVIKNNKLLNNYSELIYQTISFKSVLIKYKIILKEKLNLIIKIQKIIVY